MSLSGVLMAATVQAGESTQVLTDPQTLRPLPVQIYHPLPPCSAARPCPVAMLSPGYGIDYRSYRFLAAILNARGYVVLAIDHAAEDSSAFDFNAPLRPQMQKKWESGLRHFRLVRSQFEKSQSGWDWDKLLLVGHSLGGDQSAEYARQAPVAGLITLDNRRAVLPRSVPLLSLRASDTEADPGVLPAKDEAPSACIVKLPDARHNDMSDAGPAELRQRLSAQIARWLDGACPL
ncbi:hypothetical protein [Massilia sp. TS11]|uniref:hypothetical protein n=1 Tax=Massilia sp. TS11 TaxID=2908003 RepID=UPI001EDC6EAE|nr:hypothetical protein [Massilia sp. TS11]MCG2583008.1 hypothetical protein [Massilia sp. TS11]